MEGGKNGKTATNYNRRQEGHHLELKGHVLFQIILYQDGNKMPVAASSTCAPLNINGSVGRSPAGMAALHFPRDLIRPNVRMREKRVARL